MSHGKHRILECADSLPGIPGYSKFFIGRLEKKEICNFCEISPTVKGVFERVCPRQVSLGKLAKLVMESLEFCNENIDLRDLWKN